MTNIEQIIWDNLVTESSQNNGSKEEIFDGILKGIGNGESVAVRDGGLVLLVKSESKYIARMHIFGSTKSPKKFLRSAVSITKYIFENSDINKLYGYSADKRFITAAEKTCWSYQGNLSESYKNDDGEFVDQYIVGVTRKELNEYLRKL